MRADRRSAFMGRARCSGVFAGSRISRAGLDGFFQGTTTVREVAERCSAEFGSWGRWIS